MLDYLKKFNNLPISLRQKVSNKEAMATIETLEKKYQIALAALIMKVMVKEIALAGLAKYLAGENMAAAQAKQLAEELKEKIFSVLGDYLSVNIFQPIAPEQTPKFAAKLSAGAETQATEPVVKGASFFFSPDDEAEIRELAKKINMVEKTELSATVIEKKLEEIIGRAQINFGSADLAARFAQILKTYLRGIRNRLEAKATLSKPFANGGLSFDADSAEQVMTMADKILNSKPGEAIKPWPRIRIPELEKAGQAPRLVIAKDAAYDFSRLIKKDDKITTVLPVQEKKPLLSEAVANKIKPAVSVPLADSGQMPLIRRRFEAENLSQSPKVKIEDVKYVPKVMGPLDEIKYMDLINFRRLGKDPLNTAEKIKSKINLLEEEGYGKKLAGIKAWRLSPVNKLYLAIGHLSISANKPVDVIIEERKMQGQDYLTEEEFKAIMDLNKSLRF